MQSKPRRVEITDSELADAPHGVYAEAQRRLKEAGITGPTMATRRPDRSSTIFEEILEKAVEAI